MGAITFDGRAYFVARRDEPTRLIRVEKSQPSVGEPQPPSPLEGTLLLAVNACGVSCALLIKRFPLYFLHQPSLLPSHPLSLTFFIQVVKKKEHKVLFIDMPQHDFTRR